MAWLAKLDLIWPRYVNCGPSVDEGDVGVVQGQGLVPSTRYRSLGAFEAILSSKCDAMLTSRVVLRCCLKPTASIIRA